VPFNTKAKLVLTKSEMETLKINGLTCTDFQKKHNAKLVGNSTLLVGSGRYKIEYEINK
jgi:alpha-L-rhamnosidase